MVCERLTAAHVEKYQQMILFNLQLLPTFWSPAEKTL